MLNIYAVTFVGHRYIYNFYTVEEKLDQVVSELIRTKEYVEFYVGNDGDFDRMATSAVRRARKNIREDNSSVNLVIPYQALTVCIRKNVRCTFFKPTIFESVLKKPDLRKISFTRTRNASGKPHEIRSVAVMIFHAENIPFAAVRARPRTRHSPIFR